jgi:prepilin-type N-terminal cleavage/methylation domain-containing protein
MMKTSAKIPAIRDARGVTLVELLAALVVISIGILALVRLFPTASKNQLQDRMLTSANLYAEEKIEDLSPKDWNDADLALGRHPATASSDEALGPSGSWHRYWTVSAMAIPLDNLKRVTVTVYWTINGSRTITATTYLRR